MIPALLAGMLGGNVYPLRFASPTNTVQNRAGVAASGVYTNVRSRMPIWIGSADMSELKLVFLGWYTENISFFENYPNAYSIVKCALEKDGATSSVPVTFGGLRTKTIAAGDTDITSDSISPDAFGLSKFTRGDKYWVRLEVSVSAAGQHLPRGDLIYTSYGAAVGLAIDPASFVGGVVDGYGSMSFVSGWQNFQYPLTPIVIGRPMASAVHPVAIGDSIISGATDTTAANGGFGWSRSLTDADGVSNPRGGLKIGTSGGTGAAWNSGTYAKPQALLKYATVAVEEFGTNVFITAQPASVAQAILDPIWTKLAAEGLPIVRTKLVPRTTSTDSWATAANQTPSNAAWLSGGGARALNDWIDTQSARFVAIVSQSDVRTSATQSSDDYYKWLTDGTASKYTSDGVHPNINGYKALAAAYRSVYASL